MEMNMLWVMMISLMMILQQRIHTTISSHVVILPVKFGAQSAILKINVVTCNIPLLLSRITLKRASCHLDFSQDKIFLLGEEIHVKISWSGNYCISLLRDSEDNPRPVSQALFSSPLHSDTDAVNWKNIIKLHRQFAHPAPKGLKTLIRNSVVKDDSIIKLVDDISQSCNTCKCYRKPHLRPVVGFPLAAEFNKTVAMDIKYIDSRPVLHMIDHATRYSVACLVRNKMPEAIIETVMTHWIQMFWITRFFSHRQWWGVCEFSSARIGWKIQHHTEDNSGRIGLVKWYVWKT